MSVKEDIRAQIIGALAGAKFPIESPEVLLAAFPNGADTTCKSGTVELKAPHVRARIIVGSSWQPSEVPVFISG